jgi:hypothetical protein
MASGMQVERLALVPFSFPTYANAIGRAAIRAARLLDLPTMPADARFVEETDVGAAFS